LLALEELRTAPWDSSNFDYGRSDESGFLYCLWPARDEKERLTVVRINAEALCELAGVPFSISSVHARKALLACRDQIETTAKMKDHATATEVRIEREDLMKVA
jgi:hypothetical protein